MNKPKKSTSFSQKNPSHNSFIILFICLGLLFLSFASTASVNAQDKLASKEVLEKALKIQMPFIENQGQVADENVRFYMKTFGGALYVTDTGEMIYSFSSSPGPKSHPQDRHLKPESVKPEGQKVWTLKETLVGVSKISLQGIDKAETKANYFIGNDPTKWKTDIATYNKLSLGEVYQGIDLHLMAYAKNVEKIFTVKPGFDPGTIRLKMEGAKSLSINQKGELEVGTDLGPVNFSKPISYQKINGKKVDVKVDYILTNSPIRNQKSEILSDSELRTSNSELVYGFNAENYDKSLPLIIDPALVYSTYVGGSGVDSVYRIAVDSFGNAYITGYTQSTDFPTRNPLQLSNAGDADAFVAKINPAGALAYSTYLGGSGYDTGKDIAVDSSGNAYITGYTDSPNFPTQNPLQPLNAGAVDAFVAKINSSGTGLMYSTYLGGEATDQAAGITVDSVGNAYITGSTHSIHFPTVNPYQSSNAGGNDAFVAKIDSNGTILVYSTYLGGSATESGNGIAVDGSGNAYITGYTNSTDFPTRNPLKPGGDVLGDAFVAKMNPAGSALVYSTYLGGSASESGNGIAVDASGNAYITGYTQSTNFPTQNALQPSNAGDTDAFVAKMNPAGSALVYSTYLGGSGIETGYGIAVDSSGSAYITGSTSSTDFPTQSPVQPANAGAADAFIAKMNPAGSALVYSTYLGGSWQDAGYGIAVDSSGSAYITGYTQSTNFPTLNPLQPSFAGGTDAFVSKISGNLIDQTKYANLEFIRRIENGALRSAVRSYGTQLSNSLSLPNPDAVNSIEAVVTVNAIGNNNAFTKARIGGYFYHDSSSGGDVYAEIGIGEGPYGLLAYYEVLTCNDPPDCLTLTPSQISYHPRNPAYMGQSYTLRITYNQLSGQFDFQIGGVPQPSVTAPGTNVGPPNYRWKGIGTRIARYWVPGSLGPGDGGYVDALYDNVKVNDILHDDFGSVDGLIDNSKWPPTLEFVREQVSDGVFGMALRSYGSYANNGMNLLNAPAIKELQAELTVNELINNNALPMARLIGAFYNDTYTDGVLGTDSTGNIQAGVGIRHNGTQPVGFYHITRCIAANCNLRSEYQVLYYYEDPKTIGPNLVGKPHKISVRYDDSTDPPKFTFGFDGRLTTPNVVPPSKKGGPKTILKGIHTRISFTTTDTPGTSDGGYVLAEFTNLRQVVDTDGDGIPDVADNCPTVYNPPVVDWVDINGTHHFTTQPDFDLDGIGDVCDNCPKTPNGPLLGTCVITQTPCVANTCTTTGDFCSMAQEDSNLDGLGDACSGTSQQILQVPPAPIRPGVPLTVTATFTNGTGKPLQTIRPDCYNTTFTVLDSSGNPLPPRDRVWRPYVIGQPDTLGSDVTIIGAGQSVSVTCDLSTMYDAEVLMPQDVMIPTDYTIKATYSNYIQDPDLAGGVCAGGKTCYDLFRGGISSTPTVLTVIPATGYYIITPTMGPHGSISPPTPQTVSSGGSMTFKIQPDTGSYIVNVKVDNVSKGPISTYTFSGVNADHTISATFGDTYIIVAIADFHGKISPLGVVLLEYGKSKTFTITPDKGYHVSNVYVDGKSVGAVTSYTFKSVTDCHVIFATFAKNK